jgi:mycoredoxin
MDDLYNFSPSQIVMYTTPECGDCLRVKAFFNANHITFLQKGIEADEQAREFVARINHGFYSVPTIIFPDGSVLVEPSRRELREKFHL